MNEMSTSKRVILVDYDLAHPPEKVWRVLTESDLLCQWLMPNDILPKVGHRFTFHTDPVPGFDGTVRCEVLEVDRPKRFRYSWVGGPLNTVVTWTLEAKPDGTLLHLEQDGFTPENTFVFDILNSGWRSMKRGKIEAVLGTLA